MQRIKRITHGILSVSLLVHLEHLYITIVWWSMLNDLLFSSFIMVIFPEKTENSPPTPTPIKSSQSVGVKQYPQQRKTDLEIA